MNIDEFIHFCKVMMSVIILLLSALFIANILKYTFVITHAFQNQPVLLGPPK